MTHKLYFALSAICLIAVIATQCSNAPSRAATTSSALPVATNPQDQGEAQAPTACDDPRRAEPSPVDEAPATAEPTPAAASTATVVATDASDAEGLEMRRLIVSRDVENREPVGADSRFSAHEERIYAFMEMVNSSDDDKQVVVTFERDDGTSVGHINVNVPANAPRWRTWAWSQRINTPGTWTAVISTPDGAEIGRERFEVEG